MANQILVVTGEASGDVYAAQVVRSTAKLGPGREISFFGSGGDALRREGAEVISDIRHLAAIGPVEALRLGGNYLQLYRRLTSEVDRRGCRVALLVDFPDFNLFLARKLKRMGLKVIYYISPTVWAWRRGRIKTVRRFVDRMLCIFPFEENLYQLAGVEAEYVGHPLVETLGEIDQPDGFFERYHLSAGHIPVSVLPGSRHREINLIWPPILEGLARLKQEEPRFRFLLPFPSVSIRQAAEEILQKYLSSHRTGLSPDDFRLIAGDATNCLANSRMGIVKSGTSTLQAALAMTPFIMIYRTSPFTWNLGKLILSNQHFCIVNIISGRHVVPELLQERANGREIADTFLQIYRNPALYESMKADLAQIRNMLGARQAPDRVADALLQTLSPRLAPAGGRS